MKFDIQEILTAANKAGIEENTTLHLLYSLLTMKITKVTLKEYVITMTNIIL